MAPSFACFKFKLLLFLVFYFGCDGIQNEIEFKIFGTTNALVAILALSYEIVIVFMTMIYFQMFNWNEDIVLLLSIIV